MMSEPTFAFYIKKETPSYAHVRVFKINDNIPALVGEFKYSIGSNRGAASEVKGFLVSNKIVEPFGNPDFYSWTQDSVVIRQL
jgi:hypothetical protein